MNAAVNSVKSPRVTVADIFVKHQRLILCKYAYCVNTAVYAV